MEMRRGIPVLSAEMLLESWKPSGIYDIWGENLP